MRHSTYKAVADVYLQEMSKYTDEPKILLVGCQIDRRDDPMEVKK